jgi:hypothetical protein
MVGAGFSVACEERPDASSPLKPQRIQLTDTDRPGEVDKGNLLPMIGSVAVSGRIGYARIFCGQWYA